jgi:hypothetical protein
MSETSQFIRLADVPGLPFMPRREGHKKIDVRTVRRWAQRGWLRTALVGGIRCTTAAWLQEFLARGQETKSPATTPQQSKRERQRRQERTEMELEAVGL